MDSLDEYEFYVEAQNMAKSSNYEKLESLFYSTYENNKSKRSIIILLLQIILDLPLEHRVSILNNDKRGYYLIDDLMKNEDIVLINLLIKRNAINIIAQKEISGKLKPFILLYYPFINILLYVFYFLFTFLYDVRFL